MVASDYLHKGFVIPVSVLKEGREGESSYKIVKDDYGLQMVVKKDDYEYGKQMRFDFEDDPTTRAEWSLPREQLLNTKYFRTAEAAPMDDTEQEKERYKETK